MTKKPEPALIPPREWPQVIRWASVAATFIALVWVFRIELDTMPGAMLGPTHPLRIETERMTPKTGAPGLETWVVPLKNWEDSDSLAFSIESILANQGRISLRTPISSPNQRFSLSLGQCEVRPPFRMLYGDDPPDVRFLLYGEWLDSLSEQTDFSKYERLRSFERFSESWYQALNDDKGRFIPRLSRLFSPAAWYHSGNLAFLRLAPRSESTNPATTFQQPKGSVFGTKRSALILERSLGWFPVYFFLALLLLLYLEKRRDRSGRIVYVAGAMGTGIWSLAIWEWLLSPFDPLLWLLSPLPFLLGFQIAREIRSAKKENVDQKYSNFFKSQYPWFIAIIALSGIGGFIIGGVLGRLLIAIGGTGIAAFIAIQWCLAEDTLTTPLSPATKVDRTRPFVYLLGITGIFLLIFTPIQERYDAFRQVFPDPTEEYSATRDEPLWIGPIRDSQEAAVFDVLKQEPDVLDFYHTGIWKLPPRTPNEREWLRNAASLGSFKNTTTSTKQDGSLLRDRVLSAWSIVIDKMDRFVAVQNDSLLQRRWAYDRTSEGIVQKVTERLQGIAGEWFAKEYDELGEAGIALRNTALEANSRNPALYGGVWYDAFQCQNGGSIAVAYVKSESGIDRLRYQLPNEMQITGPTLYRIAERESLFWAALLLLTAAIVVMLLHRHGWTTLLLQLNGILFAAGILALAHYSLITILLAASIGWLLTSLLRTKQSVFILGLTYLTVPILLSWGIAITLLTSSLTLWIGKGNK